MTPLSLIFLIPQLLNNICLVHIMSFGFSFGLREHRHHGSGSIVAVTEERASFVDCSFGIFFLGRPAGELGFRG